MSTRVFLLSVIFLLVSKLSFSQTYAYSYTDPCTGNNKTIQVPTNGVTVTYYGEINTFQPADFNNGNFENWANGVFSSFGNNNPCASVVGLPTSMNIAQNTAISFLGTINSLSALGDLAKTGSTDILSSSTQSTQNGSKQGKKNGSRSNSNNGTNANSQASNPSGAATGASNGSGQSNSTPTGTTGNASGSGNSGSGNSGSGSNGSGNSGSNGSGSSGGNSSNTGGQSNGNTEGNTTPGTTPSGTTSGSSSSGSNSSGSSTAGNNTTSGNSGSNGGSETPKTENAGGTEEAGKTNLVGSSVSSIGNSTNGSSPTSKNGNRPTILASSDFVGFNFQNADVATGGKVTGGYTSMRWDGERAHGITADYTTALRGPNITGFYAIIKEKRIDLISTTLTIGFESRTSVYGTLALGQMWNLTKNKKLKAVYMLTGSYGSVYGTEFIGTAAIVGGMYDWKVSKRIDIKLMGLYVYAPYVSYYNDILLKSPHVVLPIVGTNIRLTKRFMFNINGGGAWALKDAALNYTIMMGTRMLL
jgi:hypothetical protein